MPHIPISLSRLLASPLFSPHTLPGRDLTEDSLGQLQSRFTALTRSILFQILCALAYLHDPARQIAHRDIKPNNILLTADGCVKVIDFGIAWEGSDDEDRKRDDIWPEYSSRMYFEVSTGCVHIYALHSDPSQPMEQLDRTVHRNFCLAQGLTMLLPLTCGVLDVPSQNFLQPLGSVMTKMMKTTTATQILPQTLLSSPPNYT